MNKVTKGALAAAAGAAILVGGAGTMAAWSDSSSLGAGSVTAGSLNITETSAGTWKWKGGSKDGQTFNTNTDRLVPGDAVVYSGTYDITLEGDMSATLKPVLGNLSGDAAFASQLVPSAVGGGQVTVTQSETGKVIGTQISFPKETATNDSQGKTVSLSGATITLEQN